MPTPPDDIPESTYPVLVKPVFTSQIPAPLLERASESDKYLMSQISILSQCTHWSMDVLADVNAQTRRTNGRVTRLEGQVQALQQARHDRQVNWGLVAKVGGWVGGLIVVVYYLTQIAGCTLLGGIPGH